MYYTFIRIHSVFNKPIGYRICHKYRNTTQKIHAIVTKNHLNTVQGMYTINLKSIQQYHNIWKT